MAKEQNKKTWTQEDFLSNCNNILVTHELCSESINAFQELFNAKKSLTTIEIIKQLWKSDWNIKSTPRLIELKAQYENEANRLLTLNFNKMNEKIQQQIFEAIFNKDTIDRVLSPSTNQKQQSFNSPLQNERENSRRSQESTSLDYFKVYNSSNTNSIDSTNCHWF